MKGPLTALALCLFLGSVVHAQEVAPRIGPFVVDLRGAFPKFPSDDENLALSRGITNTATLPGLGIGLDVGAHVYVFKWKVVTFGLGAELMKGRSRSSPLPADGLPVTETFTTFAPQISMNFGSGTGWSYISGGIGTSVWSVVPDGAEPNPADDERLYTVNYGFGARWFAKKHLGVSLDVRFWGIKPGTGFLGYPPSPRTTLLVISGGVAFK